jgi:diguanylate cyclase (GGDEF)-like protein
MSLTTTSRRLGLSAEDLVLDWPLNACDHEPIHLSGAIQPLGFLLVVDPVSLVIAAASENIPPGIGRQPRPLGLTLDDFLGVEVAEAFLAMRPTSNPHDALPQRISLPSGEPEGRLYDMLPHQSGLFTILEFDEGFEVDSSASARFFQQQREAVKTLLTLDGLEEICQLSVHEVRKLTGYDRVMIYRFEPEGHGHIIAEACLPDAEPFLGLHYPATDIPRQARALYMRNWIRVIADVEYDPVPIAALPGSVAVDRIDLSMSVLRSISPVHLQYLRNMGVSATMTISLIVDSELWGLIACHHGAPKRIDHMQRLACEALGQLVSVRIRAAETADGHAYVRKLSRLAAQVIGAMAASENPSAGAAAMSVPLLGMTAADGAVVEIDGVRVSAGALPSLEFIDLLVPRLAELAGAGPRPLATDALAAYLARPGDAKDWHSPAASGALFLPLHGRVQGFVLWLRGERAQTVRWAGRLETRPVERDANGLARLSPRTSFEEWIEEVHGRSLPWHRGEIAAATELAQAMPEVLQHRAQNRLVRLALHDSLTGLPNRVQLNDRLTTLLDGLAPDLATSGRSSGPGVGILFIDIDGFKVVNDTQGHQIGDELLVMVAQGITALVRPKDTAARMGGDEFVVLLPGIDALTAARIAQRIADEFKRRVVLGGKIREGVSLSIGVAVVPLGTTPGDALRQADTAMYHAKRTGRDRVAVFDHALGTAATRQQLAEEELRDAIEAGQITVHFQPIFRLASNDVAVLEGFEALARWQHPIRGFVPPDEFIPLAEQVGLIHALGDTVMMQALRQLQEWPDRRLTMAVNVSVRQLVRSGFAKQVFSRLVELGIEPARLCLEVTESQVMEQPKVALTILAELSEANVQIAIDDFGTGFSSMAYLRNLPATQLKIDRLFVSGLPHNSKDVAVVAATIQLAHSLGMHTVAEGVETAEQLAFLCKLGSDFAQGYLLGKPLPGLAVKLANWTTGIAK